MGSCQHKPIGVKPKSIKEATENQEIHNSHNEVGFNPSKIKIQGTSVINIVPGGVQSSKLISSSTERKNIRPKHPEQNISPTGLAQPGAEQPIVSTNPPSTARNVWKITHHPNQPFSSSHQLEKDPEVKMQARRSLKPANMEVLHMMPLTVSRNSNTMLKSPRPGSEAGGPVGHIEVGKPKEHKELKILRRDNTLQVYHRDTVGVRSVAKQSQNMNGFLTLRPNSARRSVAVTSVAQSHHKNLLELVEHGKLIQPAAKQVVSSSKLVNSKHAIPDKSSSARISESNRAILSSKRARLLHLEDSEIHKSVSSSQRSPPSRFVQKAPKSSRLECSIMDADADSVHRKASIASEDSQEASNSIIDGKKAAQRKFRLASAQPSRRIINLHSDEDKVGYADSRQPLLMLTNSEFSEQIQPAKVHEDTSSNPNKPKQPHRKRFKNTDSTMRADSQFTVRNELPLLSNRSSFGPGTHTKKTNLAELKKWGSMMMPSDMVKHKTSLNLLSKLTLAEPMGTDIAAKFPKDEDSNREHLRKPKRSAQQNKTPSDCGSSSESPLKMDSNLSTSLFMQKQKVASKRPKKGGGLGGKHKRVGSHTISANVKPAQDSEVSDPEPRQFASRLVDGEQRQQEGAGLVPNKRGPEHKHSLQATSRFAREHPNAFRKPELPVLNEGNSEPCSPTTRKASLH